MGSGYPPPLAENGHKQFPYQRRLDNPMGGPPFGMTSGGYSLRSGFPRMEFSQDKMEGQNPPAPWTWRGTKPVCLSSAMNKA
jgi:hypothetical protein